MEAGETAEDALRRELREELGIVPESLRALGALESRQRRWRLRVFAVDGWAGEPRNLRPDEHAELRWMPPCEARARLASAHAGFAAIIDAALSSPGPRA